MFAQTYNLDELIELGLENSYDMQTEKLNMKDSKAALRSSWYPVLPSFSTSATRSNSNGDWNDPSASISLGETIYLDDSRFFSIRNAHLTRENDLLDYENSKKKFVNSVFNNYISVLQAQKNLEIQSQYFELQKKIKEQIQIKFDTGEKSSLELKQSEINLIESKIDLQESTIRLKKSRKNLFALLNSEDEGFELSEPELNEAEEINKINNNIDRRKNDNYIQSSGLNKVQSLLNIFPTFSAGYDLGYSKQDDILKLSDYDYSWGLSFIASYNFTGIMDNYENFVKAKHNLKRTKFSADKFGKDLKIQSENLIEDYETTQTTFEMHKEKMKLAEENLLMAQERFNLGMISLTELDQIQLDFMNSQKSYNNTYYSLMILREDINLLHSNKILGKW